MFHATTILAVRHRDHAVLAGDGQVTLGQTVVKQSAKKIRRLYNGRIFKLHEHLARLERSARALSFAEIPSRDDIVEQIRRTLAANGMHDGVHLRLTLSRGLKILAQGRAYARDLVAAWSRHPASPPAAPHRFPNSGCAAGQEPLFAHARGWAWR